MTGLDTLRTCFGGSLLWVRAEPAKVCRSVIAVLGCGLVRLAVASFEAVGAEESTSLSDTLGAIGGVRHGDCFAE